MSRRLLVTLWRSAVLLVGLALAQTSWAARVALLIGNNDYPRAALDNPVNDARAMSDKLRRLGWETILVENGSREKMYDTFNQFGSRLGSTHAEVALFFYAGHGMQVKGVNYLIPTDFVLKTEDDLPYQSVDLNALMAKLQVNKNTTNIIILDACRDDPFHRSSKRSMAGNGGGGLAMVDAPAGTLIAFATSPGAVAADGATGDHGTYTKHLLANIDAPGLKAEDVFKRVRSGVRQETKNQQIPWENSSLEGDLYFSGGAVVKPGPATVVTATAPSTAARSADGSAVELEFWNTVKASNSPMSYQAYLDRYPQGEFAPLARIKIDELQRSQQVAAAVVDSSLPLPATRAFGASVTHKSMSDLDAQDQAALAGRGDELRRLASTSCPGNKRKLGIRLALDEGAGKAAKGVTPGSMADALSQRLRSAGFAVGNNGAYRLSGVVSLRVGNNRLLRLGELYVSSSLRLNDKAGADLGSILLFEESYTGNDAGPALHELINRQADQAVLQINQKLCGT